MLDDDSVVLKDKEQVTKAGEYLAKWLVTMAMLMDKRKPIVAALCDAIPHRKGGKWRGARSILLFNIVYRFAHESNLPSWWSWIVISARTLLCQWLPLWDGQVKLWFCQKACK